MPTEHYNVLQLPPAPHDAVEDLTSHPTTLFDAQGNWISTFGFRDAAAYMAELNEVKHGFRALRIGPPVHFSDAPRYDPTHGGRVHYDPGSGASTYDIPLYDVHADTEDFLRSYFGYGPSTRQVAVCGYCFHPGRKRRVCENCGRLIV